MKISQLKNDRENPQNISVRLAVGAIFKNESPYILEWIAYHRVIGINKFFIADNSSNDGTTEMLSVLHGLGNIVHIPFPHVAGEPPQMAAYGEIMRRHRHEADWFAFIDADEFLVPDVGGKPLPSVIEQISRDEGVGAIALNWATYGSSGHLSTGDGLVLERFTRRGERSWGVNNHYKSIVRSEAFASEHVNPHLFVLKDGYSVVHSDGSILKSSHRGLGISDKVVWSPLRINHYVIKSKEEFFNRKRPRGRATVPGMIRPESFFQSHDRNDVDDASVSKQVIELVKKEIESIQVAIADRVQGIVAATERAAQAGCRRIQNPPSLRPARGAVDELRVDSWHFMVRGWAVADDGGPIPYIVPMVNDRPIHSAAFSREVRPDVARHLAGASERAGFILHFPLLDIPKHSGPGSKLTVLGGGSAGDLCYKIVNSDRVLPDLLAAPPKREIVTISPLVSRGVSFFEEIKYLGKGIDINTIFDVGANAGQTVKEVKAAFPKAIVHAFEPVRKTYQNLLENVSRYEGVHCYNVALSDTDNSTALMDVSCNSVDSRIVEVGRKEGLEAVKTLTGDTAVSDIGLRKVDILKIDTEGHELRVLRGFRGCLKEMAVDFVIVECGMNINNIKHISFLEINEVMSDYGYKVFGLYEQIRELNSGIPLRRANVAFVSPNVGMSIGD